MAKIETFAKPLTLYRYRPLGCRQAGSGAVRADPDIIARELDAAKEGYVFCPTYQEMNDPMEGLYAATVSLKQMDDYDEFVQDVKSRKLGLGIACFSESWDNELMWAHYADGFRGICIAYSVPKLLSSLDGPAYSLARIAYGDRPYKINLAGHKQQEERAKAILSTKNLKWSHEREWRLFAPTGGRACHAADVIRRVYLGARMDPCDQSIVTAELKEAGLEVRQTYVNGYSVQNRPWSRVRR